MQINIRNLKDAFILLRIHFFIFLMPIFWFTLSNTTSFSWATAALIFFILHFLVYPASNGYNSYYDRDEGSIGGIKNPPKVTEELYWLVLFLDGLSVGLSLLVNVPFALLILLCLLVSKAYSYDKIRIKQYPIWGTLLTTFFQGIVIYLTIQIGLGYTSEQLFTNANLLLALFSSLFLAGSYPITQIYQHEEDSARGDKTLSLVLGIWGTFAFCTLAFSFAIAVLAIAYYINGTMNKFWLFLPFTIPVIGYLLFWMNKARQDISTVDYDHTMKMSAISSIGFNVAFLVMLNG